MKAIAVLCMVEVHTAAIIPPEGVTVGHPAAFLAAAFGGMAAPMFITISGWGIYKSGIEKMKDFNQDSKNWSYWIFKRVFILSLCQITINLFLNMERGGRFYWQTPGVLTLLAVASLITPFIVRMDTRMRLVLFLLLMAAPSLLGDYNGLDWSWEQRVSSSGYLGWLERLLWNGTYPAIPWLSYVFLGTLIYDFRDNVKIRNNIITMGLIITTISVFIAVLKKEAWALTSGEALLTFFPANSLFILVSSTMVILAMKILEGDEGSGGKSRYEERLSFLESTGKLTLTIYVAHFAVLGLAAAIMEGRPRLGIVEAFILTVGHTIIWVPISNWHQKNIPDISFERLLRK
jgi:uncharacterized membrane protein